MTGTRNDERIWLNPPKFWAATKGMPAAEVERLMKKITHLAEVHDVKALQQYDFIMVAGQAVPNFFRRSR